MCERFDCGHAAERSVVSGEGLVVWGLAPYMMGGEEGGVNKGCVLCADYIRVASREYGEDGCLLRAYRLIVQTCADAAGNAARGTSKLIPPPLICGHPRRM